MPPVSCAVTAPPCTGGLYLHALVGLDAEIFGLDAYVILGLDHKMPGGHLDGALALEVDAVAFVRVDHHLAVLEGLHAVASVIHGQHHGMRAVRTHEQHHSFGPGVGD